MNNCDNKRCPFCDEILITANKEHLYDMDGYLHHDWLCECEVCGEFRVKNCELEMTRGLLFKDNESNDNESLLKIRKVLFSYKVREEHEKNKQKDSYSRYHVKIDKKFIENIIENGSFPDMQGQVNNLIYWLVKNSPTKENIPIKSKKSLQAIIGVASEYHVGDILDYSQKNEFIKIEELQNGSFHIRLLPKGEEVLKK